MCLVCLESNMFNNLTLSPAAFNYKCNAMHKTNDDSSPANTGSCERIHFREKFDCNKNVSKVVRLGI